MAKKTCNNLADIIHSVTQFVDFPCGDERWESHCVGPERKLKKPKNKVVERLFWASQDQEGLVFLE